jgi:hypothetical protein
LLLTVSALDVWENGRCDLTASWSFTERAGVVSTLSEARVLLPPSTSAGPGRDAIMTASVAAALSVLADRIAASVDSKP